MQTETAQPNTRIDNYQGEGATSNFYTFGRFRNLQSHAEGFGIKSDRVPNADFIREPAKYLAKLIPLVKEALDKVPDEVLKRPQPRSLKPDVLREMVVRYYGLDGKPPARSYQELYTGLTGNRNRDLVEGVLAKSRHYLRKLPPVISTQTNPPIPPSIPDWDKIGPVKEYYK